MPPIRLTKEFSFDAAHALVNYDGKCRHIHGHSYRLLITIQGAPSDNIDDPKNGMVMDFGLLKTIVNQKIIDIYDHALLLRTDAPLAAELQAAYQNVLSLPFQPTCEQLCLHFADLLTHAFPKTFKLFSIRLYETPTSYAEWYVDDNPA